MELLIESRKKCRICISNGDASLFNGAEFPFDPPVVSYWSQWLGHPAPKLVIVGQDFSNVEYFEGNQGTDAIGNKTNENLYALLSGAGIKVGRPPISDVESRIFLMNSILCLKTGSMDAPVKDRWVENCSQLHLVPVLQYLQPDLVVGMGRHGWNAVRLAYGLTDAPKQITAAAGGNWNVDGKSIFAVGHCGPKGLLPQNRGLHLQQADWAQIGLRYNQVHGDRSMLCITNSRR